LSVWPVTETIAQYSAAFDYDQLPVSAVNAAKDIILDTLGALFAAWPNRHPVSRIMGDYVEQMGGTPECTVLGRGFKAPAANAALVNGTMGYAADIEGGGISSLHAAAVFVPTALVMGERQHLNGKEFIAALAVAYDVGARVGNANRSTYSYPHSFHPSAVFGTFGAAAVTGFALRLDAATFVNAYGLAGNVASGLIAWVDDPTEHSRSYGIGVAAHNGVNAGLLASRGFGGPRGIFDEMKYNIYDAYSGFMHLDEMTRNLGTEFMIEQSDGFKQYPCCGDIHTGLDALLSIVADNHLTPEDITSIHHWVHQQRKPVIDNNPLRSHNAQYIMSVAAVEHEIRWDDFIHDRREEPPIGAMFPKVTLAVSDELITPGSAIVEVNTTGGKSFLQRVEYRKGHRNNPLTPEELEAKFIKLATEVVSETRAREIIHTVRHLEQVNDIGKIIELMH
jgi:2-methylcitrate dehydratase PrpD